MMSVSLSALARAPQDNSLGEDDVDKNTPSHSFSQRLSQPQNPAETQEVPTHVTVIVSVPMSPAYYDTESNSNAESESTEPTNGQILRVATGVPINLVPHVVLLLSRMDGGSFQAVYQSNEENEDDS